MELQSVACANTLALFLLCAVSGILCIEHSVCRYYLACCRQGCEQRRSLSKFALKKKSVIILIDVTRTQILMNTATSSPSPHRATNKTNIQQSTLLLFSLWRGVEIAMNFVNYVKWWKVAATVVDCHTYLVVGIVKLLSSAFHQSFPHFSRQHAEEKKRAKPFYCWAARIFDWDELFILASCIQALKCLFRINANMCPQSRRAVCVHVCLS